MRLRVMRIGLVAMASFMLPLFKSAVQAECYKIFNNFPLSGGGKIKVPKFAIYLLHKELNPQRGGTRLHRAEEMRPLRPYVRMMRF